MIHEPLISIITVAFNSAEEIKRTIESVLAQDYRKIEYIVVDGSSTDNTLEIAKKYERIDRIVSEPDEGIYDGMNKGVRLASGEWVTFLNAGDIYCDTSTITSMVDRMEEHSDILYGDRYVVDKSGCRIYQKALPIDKIYYRMPFGHQSMLVKREHISDGYNTCYLYVADYEYVINCYQNGLNFTYCPIPVCEFMLGGRSHQKFKFVALEAIYMLTRKTDSIDVVKKSRFYQVFVDEVVGQSAQESSRGIKAQLQRIQKKISRLL